MTRAKRVALWSAILSIAYFLTLFAYIPVPFLAEEHAEQILPVVCHLLHRPRH
jgi:dolichol-phosphate mannosyltransferase subunit 3